MLDNNLQVMEQRYSALAEKLSEYELNNDISLIESKKGLDTVVFNKKDRPLLIHSKYDPEREAERLIAKVKVDAVSSIIILGLGLGYHLIKLLEKVGIENKKIFIIENDLSLFKLALSKNDFSDIFSRPNIYLLVEDNLESQDIINFIESKIDLVYEKMNLLSLPSFVKYSSDYNLIIEEINYIFNKVYSNKVTVTRRSKVWEENLLRNLDLFIHNPGLNLLDGLAKNSTVIIVSAGPSLDKNINLLKKAKGKAVIIAVDAVLKKLLSKNIIPDIVTVLDGYNHTLKYFDDLDYDRLVNSVLVGLPQFYHRIFKKWPGPIVFSPTYGAGEDFISYLERFSGFKGRINTGGSVAHLAFGLALVLQASSIVFVGQDLAFTDGLTHVSGNDYSNEVDVDKLSRGKGYLQIKDINGEDIWTGKDFYLFLQWFNKEISRLKAGGKKIRFIDATEGGARIDGTELMTLEKVLKMCCQDDIDFFKKLFVRYNKNNILIDYGFKSRFKKIIKKIEKLNKLGDKALSLLKGDGDIQQLREINNQIYVISEKIFLFKAIIHDIYYREVLQDEEQLDNYRELITLTTKALNILKPYYNEIP